MGKLRIALAQPKRTTNPLKEAEQYVNQATDEGSNIVCFPEYFLHNHGRAIKLDGELVSSFRAIAKENNIYLLTGMYELGNYSAAVLIDNAGTALGVHRKTIITNREKTEMAIRNGNDLNVFDTEFGRIGICICIENWYLENPRVLRLKGAEIIFAPSEFGMKWEDGNYLERWRMLYVIRAIENQVFYIGCTNAIEDQPLSIIVDPEGLILGERHSEGLLIGEIDLERVKIFQKDKAKPYYCPKIRMDNRRPDLYKIITNKSDK